MAARDELFGFFTGESWSERVRGLRELAWGKRFVFSLARTEFFFFSRSFFAES